MTFEDWVLFVLLGLVLNVIWIAILAAVRMVVWGTPTYVGRVDKKKYIMHVILNGPLSWIVAIWIAVDHFIEERKGYRI